MGAEEMRLPEVGEVRRRIESVQEERLRLCLMATYLFAARISEVVGVASPGDSSVARGPKGTDARLEVYKLGPLEEPSAVFRVRTAKRGGRVRLVGLPLGYEPWTRPLYDLFRSRGDDLIFPYTRQRVCRESAVCFRGLSYPIESYPSKDGSAVRVVGRHLHPFRLHALRHLRASELVEFYGFDGVDLATYGGWTFRTAAMTPTAIDRYLSLGWQRYFPKLLKERQ